MLQTRVDSGLDGVVVADTVMSEVDGEEGRLVVRGQTLPLIHLGRLFGVQARASDPCEGLVVIVEHEGRSAAVLIDEILGQQQVVVKSLEANFAKVEGITGATILGDGRVALILDVSELIVLTRTASAWGPGQVA